MKNLGQIKHTFGPIIRKAQNKQANFPNKLKIAVGELYNAEKFTSAEIAKALHIEQRQVTLWSRNFALGNYTNKPKGPIRSKKTKDSTREEKELVVLSIMEGVKKEVEEMAQGPNEQLDEIHTACSRIENVFYDALIDEKPSPGDILKIAAGLLHEVLQISDFIEGKIDSLDPKKNRR